MQILGYALILIIVGLLVLYFRWSKRESQALTTSAGQEVTVIVKGALLTQCHQS